MRYAFTGAENIAVGRIGQESSPEEVRAAARVAGAEEVLDQLPDGFDTLLSRLFSGGVDLSGGQWQRVALARSFFRDAPLVILDEPSSALDPRAEHALFSTLREVLDGRTALFISHRFSTVRGADRIIVMDAGRVVEEGTHGELMARGGLYADLYRLQSDTTSPSTRRRPLLPVTEGPPSGERQWWSISTTARPGRGCVEVARRAALLLDVAVDPLDLLGGEPAPRATSAAAVVVQAVEAEVHRA